MNEPAANVTTIYTVYRVHRSQYKEKKESLEVEVVKVGCIPARPAAAVQSSSLGGNFEITAGCDLTVVGYR